MKRINYALLRALGALALGLLLVIFPTQITDYLVISIGVVFMLPSLISIVGYFMRNGKSEVSLRFPIEGFGSFLFGLWLVIMPSFFADMLIIILGFILALGGVQQIATLVVARHWSKVPVGFFVIPVLILVAGVLAIFNPSGVQHTAVMVIGVAAIVYAVNELFNWFRFGRRKSDRGVQPTNIHTKTVTEDEITDAEIVEEIKD